MGTVKVQLNKKARRKDGRFPLRLVIRHKDKRVIKTLFSVQTKYWNGKKVSKTHPEATYLNDLINQEIFKARKKLSMLMQMSRNFSVEEVLSEGNNSELVLCILDYAKGVNYRNGRKYKNLSNHIKKFKDDVRLKDIDIEFMDDFKSFLMKQTRINSMETVNRYLKFLKTVLNDQRKKKAYDNYEVLSYKTPTGSGNKAKLTREEFDSLKNIDKFNLSRDVFCLMVYLRGTRIGDLLQLTKDNIQSGRMVFNEQKTGKLQDVKLIPEALEIVSRYENLSKWYVMPVLTLEPQNPKEDVKYQKHIESKTSIINRELKIIAAMASIDKNLSTHVARHTFANWADRSGLTSREIQNMLNHSSLAVTENYLEQLRRSDELDEAADKVFG